MKALKQKHDSENKMWWEMQKFKAELYLKRKTMEYKWKEIGEESDFNFGLDTPIGKFSIMKNNGYVTQETRYRVYFSNRGLGPVATLEEGKEKVQEYLKARIKELQDFILPIEMKQWNDMPSTITQAPKIEDDYNYLKGFYDGVKEIEKYPNVKGITGVIDTAMPMSDAEFMQSEYRKLARFDPETVKEKELDWEIEYKPHISEWERQMRDKMKIGGVESEYIKHQ